MTPRSLAAVSSLRVALLLLTALSAIPVSVRADTFNWNNTGTDFNAAASWTNDNILGPAGPPDFNDIAQFNLLRVNNPVVTSPSATAVQGIRFDTLGVDYTLSTATSQLAIGSSGIEANNSTGTNTIMASLVLNANESITQVTGGTLNVTGPVVLGGTGGLLLTIGSLSGNGTINFSPSSVQLAGDLTLQTNVNVTLPAVALLPQPPGPPIGIVKSGAATLTLTDASTYDGATVINAGKLIASNGAIGSATGSGNVIVNAGLLGGTGRLAGPTTVNAGGTITGADSGSIGTLKLDSNLTFTGVSGNTATFLVDLSGTTADEITVGGALDLSSNFDRLLFSGLADGTSSYTLATYASRSGTFNTVTNLPIGYTLLYGATELDLVPLAAIPEPATWAAGALVLGALFRSRRRIM